MLLSTASWSICFYLELWHADVFQFIEIRKNTGAEEHLFLALWIPDLFMKRVENNENWTLMCPQECPGLHEVWGEQFEQLCQWFVDFIPLLSNFFCRDFSRPIFDITVKLLCRKDSSLLLCLGSCL